jgi:hypothetical protein
MPNAAPTVSGKIAVVRAANEQGALSSHSVVKVISSADSRPEGRWGPAMRR